MLRRRFVRTLGSGALALAGGRVLEAGRVIGPWTRDWAQADATAGAGRAILLHNNENPLGPGDKAIAAMRAALTARGVPAARYTSLAPNLAEALAARHRCSRDNILVGCGSTQILRNGTFAFTSPSRALVGGSPAYEECADVAALTRAPIRAVPGTRTLHHDLDAMAAAARGAGLVFFDNPSNPAATLHPPDAVEAFLAQVRRESPDTCVLIDEAYHDYVTDPRHRSQIPAALANPGVLVARTFSKAYGMAGLRVGYAVGHVDTIKRLREIHYGLGTNVLGLSAALAALDDDERLRRERERNAQVRQFTGDWFRARGCTPTDSQGNFLFVDIGRPASAFRDACARQGVHVGRDFPPFERSHVRISLGTMQEMQTAVGVFARALTSPGQR